ncbi:MAG: hypothetical protein EZS28_020395 [Streblomastix strix]|uniref:Exportin-T n=1 Tax=Streblomastix strix TaxID=222440 RepID=A0A5J4VP52_9EUKA|nr:MAG: hypothetical protein EZS28_020395 [Streblomastix strix]
MTPAEDAIQSFRYGRMPSDDASNNTFTDRGDSFDGRIGLTVLIPRIISGSTDQGGNNGGAFNEGGSTRRQRREKKVGLIRRLISIQSQQGYITLRTCNAILGTSKKGQGIEAAGLLGVSGFKAFPHPGSSAEDIQAQSEGLAFATDAVSIERLSEYFELFIDQEGKVNRLKKRVSSQGAIEGTGLGPNKSESQRAGFAILIIENLTNGLGQVIYASKSKNIGTNSDDNHPIAIFCIPVVQMIIKILQSSCSLLERGFTGTGLNSCGRAGCEDLLKKALLFMRHLKDILSIAHYPNLLESLVPMLCSCIAPIMDNQGNIRSYMGINILMETLQLLQTYVIKHKDGMANVLTTVYPTIAEKALPILLATNENSISDSTPSQHQNITTLNTIPLSEMERERQHLESSFIELILSIINSSPNLFNFILQQGVSQHLPSTLQVLALAAQRSNIIQVRRNTAQLWTLLINPERGWNIREGFAGFLCQVVHPSLLNALINFPSRHGDGQSHLLVNDVAKFHIAATSSINEVKEYMCTHFIHSLSLTPDQKAILTQATHQNSLDKIVQYYLSLLPVRNQQQQQQKHQNTQQDQL